MKCHLGNLVLVIALAVLAGCGGDPEDRADDPASTSPGTPASTSASETAQAAEPEVVDIVSGVAAGGVVSEAATLIEDERALASYLRQFRSPTLVGDLTAVVEAADPAEGRVIGLAVIEISCDQPPSAHVREVDGRFLVTPGKVVDPHQECYAPVTSVAVLDLPAP